MPDHVTLTEAGLRDALRDPRYWTPGPERDAYAAWVSDGYKAMYNSGEAKGGTVKVRAYDRRRDGKTEHVGAYTRGAPPGGLTTPVMLAPAFNGARTVAPLIPPLLGGIIQSLPRPDLRGLFSHQPRPSLLEPAEEGPRRGTVNGARLFNVPEEDERSPGTLGNTVRSEADGEDTDHPVEVHRPQINGHQGKHTPGHQHHIPGRGELDPAVDPQSLMDAHAGRGTQIGPNPVGTAGSREQFDHGSVIGTYKDLQGHSVPTTRGTIHYDKNGNGHIVPARPVDWREQP